MFFHLKPNYGVFPFFKYIFYLLSEPLSPSLLTFLLSTILLFTASHYFSSLLPPPHFSCSHLASPFILTVFVALIANESQNLSVLRTCTTHLCVGQCFKDESLSTQRLYVHAFAFKNAVPDRHLRQERYILYVYFPALSCFDTCLNV